jgi:hypothetical protein
MSTSEEAPALIQYACERCKTRFVLPPSSRKLSIAGKVRAISMGIGRGLTKHEGLGVAYDTARRQLLSKMDDEAYQSFVQSFRFCHECRQFVCNECWSTSRRSCLTCVAKSMTGTARPRPPFAPTGPEIPRPAISSAVAPVRKGRLRRDVALVALALAIILVSLEAGILLVGMIPPAGPAAAGATATPTAEITAPPTATATAAGSPSVTLTASPSITASASASATATATGTPTPTPTKRPTAAPTRTPTPIPVPPIGNPTIGCTSTYPATPSYNLSCSIGNYSPLSGDTYDWNLDAGHISSASSISISINDLDGHSLSVVIHRSGTGDGTGYASGPPWS